MYKRHKTGIAVCYILVFIGSFFLGLNYYDISEIAVTVVSIALAVYIAAASVLLGNPYAKEMKKQPDKQLKTKSTLGVLASYLRSAGLCSTGTIIISCIYLFDVKAIKRLLFYQVVSSLSCGLFAVNVVFMWLIFVFLVNTLTKAAE